MNINKLLILTFFLTINLYSQNPLNVVVTDECEDITAVYPYTGIVNGKNHYKHSFYDQETNQTIDISIGFDGVKWVTYGYDMLYFGFYNNSVPSGMLPPFTGWIPNECLTGTLTITETLSTQKNDYNSIKIFPNPVNDFLNIPLNMPFKYEISNMNGQKITEGTSEKGIIDVNFIDTGYICFTRF